jgi:hypothetical protein
MVEFSLEVEKAKGSTCSSLMEVEEAVAENVAT